MRAFLPQSFPSLLSLTPPVSLMQSSVECLRENLYSMPPESMGSQLEALVERTEDFTDSAYTSHEQRQAILSLCQLVRQDTQQLMHVWIEAVCWHKLVQMHTQHTTRTHAQARTGIFIKTYAAIWRVIISTSSVRHL